jgi:hypothetical protein
LWFPQINEETLKLQTLLSTQFVVQFSIQGLVKPNNVIHDKHFKQIGSTLSNIVTNYIEMNKSPHRDIVKTASKTLINLRSEGYLSDFWMIDQFRTISDMEVPEIDKLVSKILIWYRQEITQCKANIKNLEFEVSDVQQQLCEYDAKGARIDSSFEKRRNMKFK